MKQQMAYVYVCQVMTKYFNTEKVTYGYNYYNSIKDYDCT
jgi:hypothetical protein